MSTKRLHKLFRLDSETGKLFWRIQLNPRGPVGTEEQGSTKVAGICCCFWKAKASRIFCRTRACRCRLCASRNIRVRKTCEDVMTIKTQIIDGLASGPSTLPKLAPQAHPVSRYVAARRLESAGLIARVGTVRTKGQHGGLRRVVWRLAATVLCFALIGCGGGSSNHRPNIPTPVIGETGWIIGPIVRGQNYSVGMPATPTPQGEGWTMALPGPGGEVDSVANHSPPSLVGATALVMRYAVTGGGFFASGETNVPGRVGLCIQRRGDNWSGEGKYQQYRLYGQSRPLLVAGEDQSLTASVWTDVKGQVVSQAVVDGVFSDLDNYSVVFGGSFASHGVYTTEPSTFTLTALEVVP